MGHDEYLAKVTRELVEARQKAGIDPYDSINDYPPVAYNDFREGQPKAARQAQIGGDHYTKMKIQPLEYALENGMGICEHAVVKYISRWRDKGGVQDLEKAKHYIDILIEREERNV